MTLRDGKRLICIVCKNYREYRHVGHFNEAELPRLDTSEKSVVISVAGAD